MPRESACVRPPRRIEDRGACHARSTSTIACRTIVAGCSGGRLVEGTESCCSVDEEARAPTLILPKEPPADAQQPSRTTFWIRRTRNAIMRSINALRWAKITMRADRWARIVPGVICRHHSMPFGTAPGQRFLAARCSNIYDGMSRSLRRGQLFSSGMMMLIARIANLDLADIDRIGAVLVVLGEDLHHRQPALGSRLGHSSESPEKSSDRQHTFLPEYCWR